MPAVVTLETRIDGVAEGPMVGTGADGTLFRGVGFGAFASGPSNDYDERNIKVGTSWGAGDIFDAALASSLVPPFDSFQGPNPADIVVAGGVLTVLNAGDEAYGYKDLGADYAELYISFELRVRAAMLTQTSADYFDVFDQTPFQVFGLYNRPTGAWTWDNDATPNPTGGPIADTWVEVQVHATVDTPPPPAAVAIVFDGAASFLAI